MQISVQNQTRNKLSEQEIIDAVESVFKKAGLDESAEASILIVAHDQMVKYAQKYLKEPESEALEHPVLSFPTAELEGPFQFPPDGVKHIGEIIVSFEKAQEYGLKESKTTQQIITDLAEHGALHLVGVHHD